MSSMIKQRDSYWDIVKGIGIVSIVIGHASWIIKVGDVSVSIGPFVYLYHLAVFFFCAGYLYNENMTDVGAYVIKRLKALYVPFVVYSLIWLVMRNLCLKIGILEGHVFSVSEHIIAITNIITFNGVGEFLAAFWFLPVMFFSMCMYALCHAASSKCPGRWGHILRIIFCILVGVTGAIITDKQFGLLYNMQIAYLMLPVIEGGHCYRKYQRIYPKWFTILLCACSAGCLGLILCWDIGYIELSRFMLISPAAFFPVTFIGIGFCLSLARIFSWNCFGKIFSYIGRHSFVIMAGHFLAMKLVDWCICVISGRTDGMSVFPHTFYSAWPVYYVAGVGLPLLLECGYMKLRDVLGKNGQKQA